MTKTILFIYGSLKRGYVNHQLLAEQEYLGEVVTARRYRVIDLGRYGGLIYDRENGVAVKGELWAVTELALAVLDEFEGGEGEYARFPIEVAGRQGVEAYYWTGGVPEGVRSGDEWPVP